MRGGGTKYRREARKGIEADTNGHAKRGREVAEKIKDIAKLYQMLAFKMCEEAERSTAAKKRSKQFNMAPWSSGQDIALSRR